MSLDESFYNNSIRRIDAIGITEDNYRIMVGLRLERLNRRYGAGTIERAGKESRLGKSTAFNYRNIVMFLLDWLGCEGTRHFYTDFPQLSYSHLVYSLSLPYELRVEELIAAADNLLSPEQFYIRTLELRGKPTEPTALFRQQGLGVEVLRNLQTFAPSWAGQEVEITVKPIRRKRDSAGKE